MADFAVRDDPCVHVDAIDGEPISISLNSTARSIPKRASWLSRVRELNGLLSGSATHLLSLLSPDGEETQWHAGAPGVCLSAGIERMAIEHEQLRDCIAAFALDERIYATEMRGGLRRSEAALYPAAFLEQVDEWRSEGRKLVHLTGGGRQGIELPNAWEIPVDMDVESMTLRHASLAMLMAGVVRRRDGLALLSSCLLSAMIAAGVGWWQSLSDPMAVPQRLSALVTNPVEPSRPWAYADIAPLTAMVAERDVALWDASGVRGLRFDPQSGKTVLTAEGGATLASTGLRRSQVAERGIEPHGLNELAHAMRKLLEIPDVFASIGEAYSAGGDLMQRNATVEIGNFAESDLRVARGVDATQALLDFARRIDGLPVTLHGAECRIDAGLVRGCEFQFSLRAPETPATGIDGEMAT